MRIIDSHQHFWKYNPAKHTWINNQMSVLKKDFLPGDLEIVFQENQVHGCVAVQADQSEAETTFLLDLADQSKIVKGVVGWIDLCSPELSQRLEKFRNHTKLCGFRHIVQDEPDPNFMLKDEFQKGLELLTPLGYTYDILIFPTQMDAAIETVKNHPKLKFVIDHIAKPNIKSGKIDVWAKKLARLASYDQVYCKVSGIITEADWDQWNYDEIKPYLDVVFSVFGVDRILFGSDWPVCLLAGSYSDVKNIVARYISELNDSDQEKIWSGNTIEFYNLTIDNI